MRASIVIPVWNRVELTRECLAALERTIPANGVEIVVVDNGSTDATPALLAPARGCVRALRNAENLGFAVACKQGAAAARGEFLVFLNNDTLPRPGWLEALLAEVEADSEVGAVGAKLLYPDGRLQHAGVAFARHGCVPFNLYRNAPGDLPAANRRRELRAVTAACMAVSRRAFERVGGFDAGYRNGFEDVDLCLRLGELGLRIVYQPACVVVHLEGQTPGRADFDQANLARLLERWRGRLFPDEDWVMVEDGLVSRIHHQNGAAVMRVEHLASEEERRRWSRLAMAQRALHTGDPAVARSILADPRAWPDDEQALHWGWTLCGEIGAASLRPAFELRLARLRLGPEPRPAASAHDEALDRGMRALRALV
jgi:GT2 family glycosyltransferase